MKPESFDNCSNKNVTSSDSTSKGMDQNSQPDEVVNDTPPIEVVKDSSVDAKINTSTLTIEDREFLLKEYELSHNFYVHDLSSRQEVIKIYTSLVIVSSGISAFLLKDGFDALTNPLVKVFLATLYLISFLTGITIINNLIAVKRTLIRTLHKMKNIRKALLSPGIDDKKYTVYLEPKRGKKFKLTTIKKYELNIVASLCLSQLVLFALIVFSYFQVKISPINLFYLFLGIILVLYLIMNLYLMYRLRDYKSLLKDLEETYENKSTDEGEGK